MQQWIPPASIIYYSTAFNTIGADELVHCIVLSSRAMLSTVQLRLAITLQEQEVQLNYFCHLGVENWKNIDILSLLKTI